MKARFMKTIGSRQFTILMIVFVNILGASMILPILPLYARRHFDLDPRFITTINASFFAAQFIAGPYLGRLSDHYGRLPILIISQIGTVISFIMLGMAQTVEILFLARVLDGITGGNIIVAQAYITDVMPPEKRTQALGYIFAAFGLGFVFGPALGGILSAAFGERIPFLIAALAATLTVLLTWFTLDESLTPAQRLANRNFKKASLKPREIWQNTPLVLILVIAFGGQFGLGLLQSTFALFGEAVIFKGQTEQATNLGIGLLLGSVGLGQLFTQVYLLKKVLPVYGEARLAIGGSFIRGLAMLTVSLMVSPLLAVLGTIPFAIGTGLMMPSLQSLTTRTVADELRGGVLGVYQSSISLSTIIATAISGTLFEINPRLPYWVGAILFGVMGIQALRLLNWSQLQIAKHPQVKGAEQA